MYMYVLLQSQVNSKERKFFMYLLFICVCHIKAEFVQLCSYMSLSVLFMALCHIKAGVVQLYQFEFSIYRFVSYQGRSCTVI